MKTSYSHRAYTSGRVSQGNVPVPQGMKTDLGENLPARDEVTQGNVPVPQGMKTPKYRITRYSPRRRSGKRPRSAGDEDPHAA